MTGLARISVVAVLLVTACAHSTSPSSKSEPLAAERSAQTTCLEMDLSKQLLARQSEMDVLIKQRHPGVDDPPALKDSLAEHSSNDVRWLAQITKTCGWPTMKAVGNDAAQAASLIAIHGFGDKPSMQYLIEQIRRSVEAGETPKEAYAMMFDKIAVSNHELQLYGTQADKIGGKLCILPVREPSLLDERRKAMNLPTMTEYLQVMTETFGEPVTMCVN